ncbi:MAG: NUDIX hydrolase [Hyphomonadaceae bacterium]|nr:NUDIX hydrolase [Hyphomonadaceae bacterium]
MSEIWEEDGDPWTVKRVTRAFENNWLAVDVHDVIHPGGREGTYGVVRVRRLAVGVLPIEPDGHVHLVGQWRFPLKRYSWEMPEGGAEPGEDPEACARRELLEETGFAAERFEPILELDLSNSLTDERAVIFLATGLTPGEATPEDTEVLRRRSAHFLDLLNRVCDGRVRDSMTVAAVLRAHHMAVTGLLPERLARAMLAEQGGKHG